MSMIFPVPPLLEILLLDPRCPASDSEPIPCGPCPFALCHGEGIGQVCRLLRDLAHGKDRGGAKGPAGTELRLWI